MQKNYFRKGFYSVKILVKWLVIGTMVGLIVGTVSSLFGHALIFVNNFRAQNPLIVPGLPVSLVAACGMVGLFCGVTNSPLTSLLIAFELFGFEGMPYFLVTIAVSYMLSGYFGLYRAQRIMYSKTEDHVVDTSAH